ncbi:hypothetical protein J6590_018400 [Homalodisca vitripennis]|nr:hypothetical protein J6590_018400 [Homalodisca vitripennis]
MKEVVQYAPVIPSKTWRCAARRVLFTCVWLILCLQTSITYPMIASRCAREQADICTRVSSAQQPSTCLQLAVGTLPYSMTAIRCAREQVDICTRVSSTQQPSTCLQLAVGTLLYSMTASRCAREQATSIFVCPALSNPVPACCGL